MNLKVLKGKTESMPVPAKAALVYTLASFITRGFHLITTPLFTRLMSVEQIGIISNFSTWQSFISDVVTLGLCSGAINIALKDYKNDRIGFIKNAHLLIFITVFISCLVNVAFYQQLYPYMGLPFSYVILMYICIFFNASKSFWMSLNRYEYKYKAVAIVTILCSVLSAAVAVIAVLLAKKNLIEDLASVRLYASSAVTLLFCIPIFAYFILKKGKIVNLEYCKFTLITALPMVVHTLSKSILSASDRAMINAICGAEAVGYYSVLYTLSSLILVFWDAINASLIPYIFKQLEKGKDGEQSIKSIASLMLTTFAGLSLLLVLFGPEIVRILASDKYSNAIYIMPPVVAGIFFTCMYTFYNNVILYHKKTKVIMLSTTGAALFNLVTNYIFITEFGYIAAAYTTLVSYILLAFTYNIVMNKVHGRRLYSDKMMWGIAIAMVVICLLCNLLYTHTLLRYMVILIVFITGILARDKIIGAFKIMRGKENAINIKSDT